MDILLEYLSSATVLSTTRVSHTQNHGDLLSRALRDWYRGTDVELASERAEALNVGLGVSREVISSLG